ncbi:hypothetical protein DPMN_181323 [Dreissena polymorpha]|nr:hypothetical protein DPMN_181323 [Dreissena polymorpha]
MNEEHSKWVLRADTETKTAIIKVMTRLNGKREQTGRKQRFDSGYASSAGSRALSERLSEAMQPTDQTQEMGHSDQPLMVSEHDTPIQGENIRFFSNYFQS